jgi:hypothetical protein
MSKDDRRLPEPIPPPPYDIDELFPEEPMQSPAELALEPASPHDAPPPPSAAATNVDRGALTQLLSAAQQCGLSINADTIIEVRDRELRAGRYQKAFDIIERIYVQVAAQIARRQEELRRQEMQYRSGALKMSPKQWLLLQRRETEKTQRIERARRHFTRVLDGLTILRAAKPQ